MNPHGKWDMNVGINRVYDTTKHDRDVTKSKKKSTRIRKMPLLGRDTVLVGMLIDVIDGRSTKLAIFSVCIFFSGSCLRQCRTRLQDSRRALYPRPDHPQGSHSRRGRLPPVTRLPKPIKKTGLRSQTKSRRKRLGIPFRRMRKRDRFRLETSTLFYLRSSMPLDHFF